MSWRNTERGEDCEPKEGDMAKATLGSGARFKALKTSLAKKGDVRNPGAVAAAIGRKKYGPAKFQKLAASGKKHLTNDYAHGETIQFTESAKSKAIKHYKMGE